MLCHRAPQSPLSEHVELLWYYEGLPTTTRPERVLPNGRFAQVFREQVGVTPKLYCRLRRFQSVVRRASAGATVRWAEMAEAGGYSDQSHLSREFREFSGLSPAAWLAAERPSRNHVVIR